MSAKVLVTGGAGFIGSHIVEALLKRGAQVSVLDNFSTGFKQNLVPFLKDIDLIKGDLRSASTVRRALKGKDIVIHQGAIRSVPKSLDNPTLSHDVNATGTLVLLNEALKAGVRRFVYASSSSVYGNCLKFPQRETFPVKPISPYGTSKLAGENYCYAFYNNFGLETVALRYFNVYGPHQNPESKYSAVVPAFIDPLRKGKPPVIDGTGKQSRDFTYVKDVARANLCAAFGSARVAGEVFNVAGGRAISVLQVYNGVARILKSRLRPKYGPRRKGDPMKTYADTSHARKVLKWVPKVSFKTGLNDTVNWFIERE